jgi:DNA polymerase III subunit gamma/tau
LDRMIAQAERLGPGTLSRFAEIVHTGLVDMRGATAPRLLLELLCARMLLPGAVPTDAAADSAVLQRLERMERRVTVAGSAEAPPAAPRPAPAEQAPRPTPAAPAPVEEVPAEAPSAPVESPPVSSAPAEGGMDAAGLRRLWSTLLGEVRKVSRSTEAMLTNATVQSIEGDTVVIAHPAAPLARRLGESRNVEAIAKALEAVIGGKWVVRCVHAEPGAGGATAAKPATKPDPPTYQRPNQPPRDPEPPAAAPPPPSPPANPAPGRADEPPPPEPPTDEDFYDGDEDSGGPTPDVPPPNPEADMVKLLTDKLGARPIER